MPLWAGKWRAVTYGRTKRKKGTAWSPWNYTWAASGCRNPLWKERGGEKQCCFRTANRVGGWCWGNAGRRKWTQSENSAASNETQQQPNTVVLREKVWEAKETAADNQKEETPTVISLTPIESKTLNTGKSLFTRAAQEGNGNAQVGSKNKKGLGRFKSSPKKM